MALWMAAHLQQNKLDLDMKTLVQTAMNKEYTAQGEMFSGSTGAERESIYFTYTFIFSIIFNYI